MEALSLVDGKIHLDVDMCLGCGVCVRNCSFDALKLVAKESRTLTPINMAHRVVLMAIDKNMLGDLMFDNSSLASHRIMASFINVILKLPPAKQLLANQQIRSKYLARMCEKM
jgi:Fe-S-cluster-containing hydrogenase component 2